MRRDAGPRLLDATCAFADASFADAAGRDADLGELLGREGAYRAGVRTVELRDASRDRVLPVEIWYPIARDATDGTANIYRIDLPLYGPVAAMCTPARRDAAPLSSGSFPLVIFSHGFGGIRFQSFFLTEFLATHGFVVAAPDHPTNTLADFARFGDDAVTAQSAVDRPLDVLFVRDALLRGIDGLAIGIDPARIAVSGHSFGAWTAIESARRATDLRVVVPLAPGFRAPSTPAVSVELARPLLLFGGSEDRTTPFDTDQRPAYEAAVSPKALVRVLGAGHMDFSDVCGISTIEGFFDDGCDPARIDPAIVHDRVRVLVLAFLRRYLDGDPAADAWLEPAAVSALGDIEYTYAP
jgi:predicted dienelactone hydrolase